MFQKTKNYINDFLNLIFPHYCEGCGSDSLNSEQFICLNCLSSLPATGFENMEENTIEKIFYGRLNVQYATAGFYFTKQSLIQHLIFLLKYKANKEAGFFLGRLLGKQLSLAEKFNDIDAIIPLPLNTKKIILRGYNQAEIIAQGMNEMFNKPVLNHVVDRVVYTNSQTKRSRVERWENMKGVFEIKDADAIKNKHILLVDDIVTTGATLEACGNILLKNGCKALSIATIAYTVK
jgi:ComF family protein